MKKQMSGIAGAARIKNVDRAGLARAEKHGKRLDKTGQSRAINDVPPVTSTGLDLQALYERHVEGAFVPTAKSSAMHLLIQFPTELVDGVDADYMLRHARGFAESVFGDEAIFADRLDRDETSQQVCDLFLAPRYIKTTKHQSKPATSTTFHLKALAKKYGEKPLPFGYGRALQSALHEYMRDVMQLEGVERGKAKAVPGEDWKSAEQQRAEKLDAREEKLARSIADVVRQKALLEIAEVEGASRAAGRDNALADRERQASEREQEVTRLTTTAADRESAISRREAETAAARICADAARIAAEDAMRRADEDRREAAMERAEARRHREEQDAAIARQRRELVESQAAAAADRAAAASSRREIDAARTAAIALRDQLTADVTGAKRARQDTEAALAAATSDREAAATARRDLDDQRALHIAQLTLLARAADDRNGLELQLAERTFRMRRAGMIDDERAIHDRPWTSPLIAVARSLAVALDGIRDFVRRLAAREKAIAAREAAAKAREAKLEQDQTFHDVEVAGHHAAILDLDRRRAAADAEEARAATTMSVAKTTLAAASAAQTQADALIDRHDWWVPTMDLFERNPGWVEVVSDDRLRLDPAVAQAARPDVVARFNEPVPAWVVSLTRQRIDLADALQRADDREQAATYATERLTDMIEKAGPVLMPSQQPVATAARRIARQYGTTIDDRER